MEEIDRIIIDSLKNLTCDIDETITHLKQFDPDMVLEAISTCLEHIIPGSKFPKRQPPSMSVKLKMATNLADQIKDLGFRGDIGYQTILYCNEIEIRRVLMFLVERLPRETSKTLVEQTGYVPTLVKEIEKKIKDSMSLFWLPSSVMHRGCRKTQDSFVVCNTGDACPLRTKKLKVSDCRKVCDDMEKMYWVHNVPEVTKQCDQKTLLPSLMFNDFEIEDAIGRFSLVSQSKSENNLEILEAQSLDSHNTNIIPADIKSEEIIASDSPVKNGGDIVQHKLQTLVQDLKEAKSNYIRLQEAIRSSEMQLSQANSMKCDEDKVLHDTLSKINLKSKTLSVVSKEENFLKLKKLVENSNSKLIHLANQWNEVQTPLLEEYKSLQNTLNSQDIKWQQDQAKVKKLRDLSQSLTTDLNEKKVMEEKLKQKLEHLNKNNNRSGYTRRIFEIVGNIKKQDAEIQKILKDTRDVQREISMLTGQVDRSFTLSDELIFRDAKQDETARKAYKLLVVLHEECSNIIKAVTDLGLVERESRNIQEQIDSETAKEIAVKLENVEKDLIEIRKEAELLMQQQRGRS